MKIYFYALIIASFMISCKSNQKVTSDRIVAVAPNNLNVLFLHIDNPLSIAASGIPSEQLRVSIDHGEIVGKWQLYS